jgi:hypothetical protein
VNSGTRSSLDGRHCEGCDGQRVTTSKAQKQTGSHPTTVNGGRRGRERDLDIKERIHEAERLFPDLPKHRTTCA